MRARPVDIFTLHFPTKCSLFNWQETVSANEMWWFGPCGCQTLRFYFPQLNWADIKAQHLCVFAFVHTVLVCGLYLPPPASVCICVFLRALAAQCVFYRFIMARRQLCVSEAAKSWIAPQNAAVPLVFRQWKPLLLPWQPHGTSRGQFSTLEVESVVIVMASFFGRTFSPEHHCHYSDYGPGEEGEGRKRERAIPQWGYDTDRQEGKLWQASH